MTFFSSRHITHLMQINHIDGHKRNKHPGNLELVTAADNAWRATRMLGLAKLTEVQVKRIRQLVAEISLTERRVAARPGVDPAAVSLVYRRKAWKHGISKTGCTWLG